MCCLLGERGADVRCYLGNPVNYDIPADLGDPVLDAAQERWNKFLRQTVWGCSAGLLACMAAIGLAKREENIVPMFFMWGPGGIGMSMFTKAIHVMLGDELHKYLDGNVLFFRRRAPQDDRAGRHRDLLDDPGAVVWLSVLFFCFSWLCISVYGCVVSVLCRASDAAALSTVLAQERPTGGRGAFRLDIWKRLCSADGIAGRLPYGIITRMFYLIGVKFFELNHLIQFHGVVERDLESVLRRS